MEYDGNGMYNTAVCEMQDGKIKRLHSALLHHSKRRGGERSGSKECNGKEADLWQNFRYPWFEDRVKA